MKTRLLVANGAPLYAVGHGLSYTAFDYSSLRLSPDHGNPSLKFMNLLHEPLNWTAALAVASHQLLLAQTPTPAPLQ